jgi:hypothetical protein
LSDIKSIPRERNFINRDNKIGNKKCPKAACGGTPGAQFILELALLYWNRGAVALPVYYAPTNEARKEITLRELRSGNGPTRLVVYCN